MRSKVLFFIIFILVTHTFLNLSEAQELNRRETSLFELLKRDSRIQIDRWNHKEPQTLVSWINKNLGPEAWLRVALTYRPSGAPVLFRPPGCNIYDLRVASLVTGLSESERTGWIQKWLEKCDSHLHRYPFTQGAKKSLIELAYAKYEFQKNSLITPVKVTYSNGLKVRGALALKPGRAKRPFLLVICGLNCDVESSATSSLLMQLFDMTPFNVLVLASSTGAEFAEENKRVMFGGFEEGLEVYQFAEYLKSGSELRDTISSIHLLGISLGGHSSLFASLYASYDIRRASTPSIDSVTVACPAIDLQSTVEKFDTSSKIIRWAFWEPLKKTIETKLGIPIEYTNRPWTQIFAGLFETHFFPEIQRRWPTLPRPFQNDRFSNLNDYWRISNFINKSNDVIIPTTVIAAKDDPAVKTSVNTAALKKKLTEHPNKHIRIVELKKGSHCGISQVYGFDITSGILSWAIPLRDDEKADRSLVARYVFSRAGIRFPLLSKEQKFFGWSWLAKKNERHFILSLRIWNPKGRLNDTYKCGTFSMYGANLTGDCVRHYEVKVNWSELGLNTIPTPENQTEAESLSRWANASLTPLDAYGNVPIDTVYPPTHIEVWNY
ncbi:MAG: hypothetical protein COT74_08185 [Bdellovibrionales bacterium CG10_big_fil_rev_8_21_14_0_10_45_34]|nr:MAG: hypothetical protein COT74_08185 [Bdellovibrionales bacterium CG10_big_fil_rev_8_21_14_0_10_45_34]